LDRLLVMPTPLVMGCRTRRCLRSWSAGADVEDVTAKWRKSSVFPSLVGEAERNERGQKDSLAALRGNETLSDAAVESQEGFGCRRHNVRGEWAGVECG
jgi:hypothetical protein